MNYTKRFRTLIRAMDRADAAGYIGRWQRLADALERCHIAANRAGVADSFLYA